MGLKSVITSLAARFGKMAQPNTQDPVGPALDPTEILDPVSDEFASDFWKDGYRVPMDAIIDQHSGSISYVPRHPGIAAAVSMKAP